MADSQIEDRVENRPTLIWVQTDHRNHWYLTTGRGAYRYELVIILRLPCTANEQVQIAVSGKSELHYDDRELPWLSRRSIQPLVC